MKRLDEMNEEELIELRATMTPEQIKEVMEKEEAELNRRMRAFGVEASVPHIEEEEEDEGEKVSFNPQTGEVVEIDSTLVVREKKEALEVEEEVIYIEKEDDFSYFEILTIEKIVSDLMDLRRTSANKVSEFLAENHGKITGNALDTFEKGIKEMRKEARILSVFSSAMNERYTLIKEQNYLGEMEEEARRPNIKEKFKELPKELIAEINREYRRKMKELLDIL